MKRRDLLLIGGIVLIALALLLFLQLGKKPGAEVIIRVDGQEQGRYSLSADGTYSLNGGTNLLRIENGKARMEEASCPDHYCIHYLPAQQAYGHGFRRGKFCGDSGIDL